MREFESVSRSNFLKSLFNVFRDCATPRGHDRYRKLQVCFSLQFSKKPLERISRLCDPKGSGPIAEVVNLFLAAVLLTQHCFAMFIIATAFLKRATIVA